MLMLIKRQIDVWQTMPLFRKFDQATTMRVLGRLYHWFFVNLNVNHLTLNLHSTVMTRYEEQVEAARSYNLRIQSASLLRKHRLISDITRLVILMER